MSSSKFASLEGVDFDSPDVYETRSPSPARKTRGLSGGRGGGYGTSEDESEDDDDDEYGQVGDRHGRNRGQAQKKNRKVGQAGQEGEGGPNEADIVRTHLDADEAAKRFRDATGVESKGVDFSGSIHRRKKKPEYYPRPVATFETHTYSLGSGTGYKAADDDAELDQDPWHKSNGEKESPVDRFRRLRFELEELEKEVQQPPTAQSTEPKAGGSGANAQDSSFPSALLAQLHVLRAQLTKLDEQDALGEARSSNDMIQWQEEARKLLHSLEVSQSTSEKAEAGEGQQEGKQAAVTDGTTTGPASSQLTDLDRRLAGLETLVGVQDALQDESKTLPRPMLPSLARIEHLLTLLTQPRHLDGISRRIKVLVSELERVHEARRKLVSATEGGENGGDGSQSDKESVAVPPETLKRLDGVLPFLSKVEPLLPVVPTLLARLHSLSSLHASSAAFVHDVDAVEGVLRASHTQNKELQTMLQNLEKSFNENEKRTKENMAIVEERIETVLKRMDALAR